MYALATMWFVKRGLTIHRRENILEDDENVFSIYYNATRELHLCIIQYPRRLFFIRTLSCNFVLSLFFRSISLIRFFLIRSHNTNFRRSCWLIFCKKSSLPFFFFFFFPPTNFQFSIFLSRARDSSFSWNSDNPHCWFIRKLSFLDISPSADRRNESRGVSHRAKSSGRSARPTRAAIACMCKQMHALMQLRGTTGSEPRFPSERWPLIENIF